MHPIKERIKLLEEKVKTGCKHAKKELKQVKELFDKIDTNDDGLITKKEMKKFDRAVKSDDLDTK